MDTLAREDMRHDRRDQWHQRCCRRAHPVGERRHVEIDAFAGVGRALTVERQMQAVFGK
jgi:hypothetical protein